VGNVRQAALLIARPSQPELMGTGDRARVLFHFCHRPEYIPLKARFIFSEGRTRGVGTITSLICVDSDEAKEILDHMAIRRSGRSPARKGSHTNLPSFASLTPSPTSTSVATSTIGTEDETMKEDKRQMDVPETNKKSLNHDDAIQMATIAPPTSKGSKNVETFIAPIPKQNKRQSKSKSPPNRQQQPQQNQQKPITEEPIIQNKSILGLLDENRKLEQTEINVINQK